MVNLSQRKKRLLLAALAVSSLALAPAGAEAAEESPRGGDTEPAASEYTLDEIVVTATRTEKAEIDVPATTTVITAEELEESAYRNAYEAIDQQIGITSTSYGDAGAEYGWSASRITTRGYDKGTLVLVDGVPMNLKNYSSLENIPKEMIERIEIVKGSNSVLYGSEAMGGVINVILKKPAEGEERTIVTGTVGNYFTKGGIAYQSDRIIIGMSRELNKNRSHCNYFGPTKMSTNDISDGTGQKNRFNMALKATDEITLHYNYTEGQIRRSADQYKTSNWSTPGGGYDYTYYDYRQTADIVYQGKDNGWRAVLGYNQRRSRPFDNMTNKARYSSNESVDTWDFNLSKEMKLSDKDTLLAGYSYTRGGTHIRPSAGVERSGRRNTNAVFLSWDKKFSDKFSTIVGLRGNYVSSEKYNQHIWLPQFQTNYKFDENTAWYVNVGRSFQMPDLDSEVSTYKDNNWGTLKPESGWTYETGVKLQRGKETYKLAVYHMDFDNKLGWSGPDNLDQYGQQYAVNKGQFRNTGVELEYANHFSKRWTWRLGAAFSNPEVKDPSVKNPQWKQDSARLEFMAGLDYHQDKWFGNLNFKYLGDRENAYNAGKFGPDDVPSKLQLNLNVGYKAGKNDEWTLGIYNLLDRDNISDKYGSMDLPCNYRLTYTHAF